jgi:hypothetical protein
MSRVAAADIPYRAEPRKARTGHRCARFAASNVTGMNRDFQLPSDMRLSNSEFNAILNPIWHPGTARMFLSGQGSAECGQPARWLRFHARETIYLRCCVKHLQGTEAIGAHTPEFSLLSISASQKQKCAASAAASEG